MLKWKHLVTATAAVLAGFAASNSPAEARDLTISAGLSQVHFWVGQHMDPFADAIDAQTDGEITFTRFYAGELVRIGQELDALQAGTIDVAAPLLAPYHEGRFPLSDITQMPTYGTDSPMVTRAFQKLMDSDEQITEGKTFYEYEIVDKGIVAWPLGVTAAYAISTTERELRSPEDFEGVPLRAGSALHTIILERLGVTPVTMPSAEAYEAMSRGTIEGLILSVGDWISYSFEELLTYTITGVSFGHWGSYIAVTEETFDSFTDEQREIWDRVARDMAIENASVVDEQDERVLEEARQAGGTFVDVEEMSDEMQDHIAQAAAETWVQWVEQTEAAGHPAKATARLWAELVRAEGGEIPDGVDDFLAD